MNTTMIPRPTAGEYGEFAQGYIDQIDETDIVTVLSEQIAKLKVLLGELTEEQVSVLHEPYTWTLKQVIGHCIDTERVFGYRVMRFAAEDGVAVPGFDQDIFVANTRYEGVTMAELLDEMDWLRKSNIALLKRIDPSKYFVKGVADGSQTSVRALAFMMGGHLRHHLKIIQQRLAA